MTETGNDLPTRNEGTRDLVNTSKLDKLLGRHTKTIVVLIIFLTTLLTLAIYLIFEENKDSTVISGLFAILTTVLGFFIGQNSSSSE